MKHQHQLLRYSDGEAATGFESSPSPATRVFTSLSDVETDVSSTFGEDLERNAKWT